VSPTSDPLVPEDQHHPPLSIDLHGIVNPPEFDSSTSYFDFKRANVEEISRFLLSFNMSKTFASVNADMAMTTFCDAIYKSILNHVPTAYYRPSNFPVWFSKELIDIESRQKLQVVLRTTDVFLKSICGSYGGRVLYKSKKILGFC